MEWAFIIALFIAKTNISIKDFFILIDDFYVNFLFQGKNG